MPDETDGAGDTGSVTVDGDTGYVDRAKKSAIDNFTWVLSRVIFAVALLMLTIAFEVDIKKLMTGNVLSAIESHDLERFREDYDKVHELEVALSQVNIKAVEIFRKSGGYSSVSTGSLLLDISALKNKVSNAETLFEFRGVLFSDDLENTISMFLETAVRHHAALEKAHGAGISQLSGEKRNLLYSQSKQLEDLIEDISVFAPKYREQLKEKVAYD